MIKLFNKMFICMIFFLILAIFSKSNSNYKIMITNKLYHDNIDFYMFSNIYNKYLGGLFPIENIFELKSTAVFNEKLVYNSSASYKDGVKLDVGYNYLVPCLADGIVIYIGEKKDYGNVVIIDDGVKNIWYGNICNTNNLLYDHIEKGEIIGEVCDNYLYLLYNKDNEFLSYTKYLE